MRKIYIVGTSHQKLTKDYKQDLIRVIELANPDQVLLEKLPIELARNKFYPNRPEMKVAYEWAM